MFPSIILALLIWPIWWIITGKNIVEKVENYFGDYLKPDDAEDE